MMSEVLITFFLSLAALTPVVAVGVAALHFRRWRPAALINCSLLLCLSGTTVTARPRHTAPLKFEIKSVDSATGKPKSNYFLGETVSIVFTLTNQGRVARTITELQDTSIPIRLISMLDYEDTPDTQEGSRGGTGGSYVDPDGTVYWTDRTPRKMTLAPGQSVSVKIDDLGRFFARRLQDGNHTFTAIYNYTLKATTSFRIVIDEAKSLPVLEQMAAAPVRNGDESDRTWAEFYLRSIRQPSISGRITDADGKPLKEVTIYVGGSEKTHIATLSNGRYRLTQMTQGGTYTLSPSETDYTFEPPSRTVANLNSKLTGVDFTATRVTASTNVASEYEGATVRASSALDKDNSCSVDNAIDDLRSATLGGTIGIWCDATPGVYPDWLEINFKGMQTIDWINVFTLKDVYKNAPEPEINETFSKYGITDFDVQYWNGRVWKNVPGGAIRGNRNVWRKIDFPRITTSKIRVVVRNALDGQSRITEIEAFHVNLLPVAKIIGRSKGRTGSSIQFRSKVVDRDGTIHRYYFDFGDGTPPSKAEFGDKTAGKKLGLKHPHRYTQAGTYLVTLGVTDDRNDESKASATVIITDPQKLPEANAGGPYEGIAGGDVSFEGRASYDPDGRIVRYRWTFGDGTTGARSTTSHRYAVPGTYKVTLLVIDNDGQTARATTLVRIAARPPKP